MNILGLVFALHAVSSLKVSAVYGQRDFTDFNRNIDWISGEEFKAMDLSTNTKPIAVLLTQPWCGACKTLKGTMNETGNRLVSAAKQYMMVSVDGKENDDIGEAYAPDGQYIPRIILAEPSGKVRPDLYNPKSNPKHKYFPPNADSMASTLEQYASQLIHSAPDEL